MSIDIPLTIERLPGKNPGTEILRLTGPLILTNVLALRFEFREYKLPALTILDMSGVDYIDSAGMGEIINHEVYCRDNHVKLIVAGAVPRVLSTLKITKLNTVLTLVGSVAEAEPEG
jgi:anti-anti-sigma factor